MRLDEPSWWYDPAGSFGLMPRALSPIANIVSRYARKRYRKSQPYVSRLPVICVGNFTVGGTGKTPLAAFIVDHLKSIGERPVVLARGYGGRLAGPVLVDPERHTARDVGDEPLLHAAHAPVIVARDRAMGARLIEQFPDQASVIVMDDGLQNYGLAKDLSIAVVDAARGFGNGRVLPAGPLRAPLDLQVQLADLMVLTGGDDGGRDAFAAQAGRLFSGPILRSHVAARGDTSWLLGQPLAAFAGIANPQRFFRLVEALGGQIVLRRAFRDHRSFTEGDARALLSEAAHVGALLVTTEKDWVRLRGGGPSVAELQQASRVLPIGATFEGNGEALLTSRIANVFRR